MLGRPMRAATTVSIINLATQSVAMGTAARSRRSNTVADAYPRCVCHTRRRNAGIERSERARSRQEDVPPGRLGGSFCSLAAVVSEAPVSYLLNFPIDGRWSQRKNVRMRSAQNKTRTAWLHHPSWLRSSDCLDVTFSCDLTVLQ